MSEIINTDDARRIVLIDDEPAVTRGHERIVRVFFRATSLLVRVEHIDRIDEIRKFVSEMTRFSANFILTDLYLGSRNFSGVNVVKAAISNAIKVVVVSGDGEDSPLYKAASVLKDNAGADIKIYRKPLESKVLKDIFSGVGS